jgi:hypothetical protein
VLRHDRNHHGWVFRALALVELAAYAGTSSLSDLE